MLLFAFSALLLSLASCHEEEKQEEDGAGTSLMTALHALQVRDYDTYLSHTLITGEDSSVEYGLMKNLLCVHQDQQILEKGSVAEMSVINSEYQNDTVCTVFYKFVYSDKSVEEYSQKMRKVGEEWKICSRN